MKLKNIDKAGTVAAVLIVLFLLIFPWVNPCTEEDGRVCTWNAQEQGNGTGYSVTDFYGVTIYHPWSNPAPGKAHPTKPATHDTGKAGHRG